MKRFVKLVLSDRAWFALVIAFVVIFLCVDALVAASKGHCVFSLIDLFLAYQVSRSYFSRWRHQVK